MNIKTKIQKSFLLISIVFLSASCVPFGASNNGGILKTTNGGGDWLASNNLKDDNQGNLNNTSVAVLEFDPKNDQRIFMASYEVVYIEPRTVEKLGKEFYQKFLFTI